MTPSLKGRLETAAHWWLSFGLFVQLAGLCLIADGSRYATNTHVWFFLPAALLTVFAGPPLGWWHEPATRVLLLFLGWVALLTVVHPGPGEDWRKGMAVVALAFLYVAAFAHLGSDRRLILWPLAAFVAVAAICAWGSLYEVYYVQGRAIKFRGFRLTAWGWHGLADFGNALVSALYYGVALVAALYLALRHAAGIVGRGVALVAIGGLAAYLYFTYSRGVWIAALLGCLALCWLSLPRRQFRRLSLGGLVLFAAVLALHYESLVAKDFGLSYRDVIWANWLDSLDSFWLWGAGANAVFPSCIPELKRCFNQAHNLYLQVFYEFGVLGALLLVMVVAAAFVQGWRRRGDPVATLGLALLVYGTVAGISSFHDIFLRPGVYWLVFWLPIGILLGIPRPLAIGKEPGTA